MTRWPLRWTIPGIALVLVLLTELVLGAATLALLNHTLVAQVDTRLGEAMTTIENRPGTVLSELGRSPNPNAVDPLRPRSDVLVAVIRADGAFAEGLTGRLNNGRPVPTVKIREVSVGAYTSRAEGELWRVLVRDVGPAGGGGATVAVMMPLRDPGAAATALRRGIIVLGLAVAVLAAAIAEGDLTRRVPDYPRSTEAGSLAASLNVMIDRLHGALVQGEATQERRHPALPSQTKPFPPDHAARLRSCTWPS